MKKRGEFTTTASIIRLVGLSVRYPRAVILALFLLAALSAIYFTRHVVISTDSKELMSSSLSWRQQEVILDLAFPQCINRILAVIDAATPEAADDAADALVKELSSRSDVIHSVDRVDGGEFFERNGILYLSLEEVRRNTAHLISAQPFLGTLAADPTLRGVIRTVSQSLEGVRLGRAKPDDLRPALAAIANALEALASGKTTAFSWRTLIDLNAAADLSLGESHRVLRRCHGIAVWPERLHLSAIASRARSRIFGNDPEASISLHSMGPRSNASCRSATLASASEASRPRRPTRLSRV